MLSLRPLHLALVAFPLAPELSAQTLLAAEGDAIPGVGLIDGFRNVTVNDAGEWLILVDTDHPDTDSDYVVLGPNGVVYREGQDLSLPAGAVLDSFDSLSLTNWSQLGWNARLESTSGPLAGFAVYLDDELILQDGQPSAAPGWPAGTFHTSFASVAANENSTLLVIGTLEDPADGASYHAATLLDAASLPGSEVILAREGETLPGAPGPVTELSLRTHQMALANSGSAAYCVSLNADVSPDAIYLDSTLLALEGAPSPVAGRNWLEFGETAVDLNDHGDYVLRGRLEGDFATSELIVRNGLPFRQLGDAIPAIAPFVLDSFGVPSSMGNRGPLYISNTGSVLWWGQWNNPDVNEDEGLFIDDEPLLLEGVSRVGGLLVTDVEGGIESFEMSDNGQKIIAEVELADGRAAILLLDNPSSGVASVCTSTPNSTGAPARLFSTGSNRVSENDFLLRAAPVPAQQPGIFFYGPGSTQIPFGNGFRCVSPGTVGIFRFSPVNSGAAARFEWPLDLTMPPQSSGQIQAGSTWYFQCWFRDPAAGGAFFDLSDALEVQWVP